KAKLDGTDATLDASGEKLAQMQAQNTQARAQMQALANAPEQQRQQARAVDRRGEALIEKSFDLEARLHQVQREYESSMRSVPAAEEPEPLPEEAAAAPAGAAALAPSASEAAPPAEDVLVQRQIDPSAPQPDASAGEGVDASTAVAEP